MGNTYNVIEAGVIQCACGGKVTLTSTAKVERIAGAKPLYLKDIIGAPVACPRSKNKCTKVASISTAGTETNVKSTTNHFLLRTDGFKTDKGRAVVLKAPGQTTSKIIAPPSIESSVVKEEEPLEEAIKQEEEIKQTEKYSLYLVRKSEDIYRPLRPTRAFLKSDDTYVGKKEFVQIKDNVHVHTFAYVYVIQDDKIQEYKVLSRGTLYSEKLQEIFFEKTKTKIKYNYIPIYEQSEITISYSSIKLINKIDILKLKKQIINPKEPDNKNSFYFKDSNSINKIVLTDDDLKLQKEYKVNEEDKNKRLNILCIIEDILAQLEDMYERYYTNYKLAYAYNDNIIEDIRKKNEYSYIISNTLNHFYVDEKEQKDYDENIKVLKKDYESLIEILRSSPVLIKELLKDNNVATVIEKSSEIALSYLQETLYIKKDFFKKIVLKNVNQTTFIFDKKAYAKESYKKTYQYTKSRNIGYIPTINEFLDFIPKNTKLNIYKDNPDLVLSLIVFSIFFSLKFEDIIKKSGKYDEIHKLRKEFYFTLKNTKPMPQIGEENIRDTKSLLENQKPYKEIFQNKNKLLSEYESLEHNKKLNSFNYSNKTIKFNFLYHDKGLKYYKVSGIESPQEIISKIATKLKDKKLEELLGIYQGLTNIDEKTYVISAMNIIYLLHASRTLLDEETNLTTPFNTEHKKLLEYISDLTRKRKALSDEDKKYIEDNYAIHEIYNTMQYNLITHAFLSQKQKRKDTVEAFLNQFPAKKVKYELVLPNLLDNNFDEEFNAKAKVEELYETLKGINGSSSNVGDAFDEYKDSKLRDGTLNKFSSNLNTHIKSLSFLVAGANIARILSGKDKLTVNSTIGLANDISLLTKSIANTMEKNIELVKAKEAKGLMQKIFSKENVNITKSASGKVIAFLGIPAIIISSGFEIERYAKDEDYDAAFFVTLKSALTLTLLLAVPTTVAVFLLLAVIELVWYLLSHMVIDSKLEKYIKKSLFFKDIPRIDISYKDKSIWGKSFKSEIFLETISNDKELKALNKKGFSNIKEIKNFIGDNYNKHNQIFEASLKNELNQINIALLGYKIEHLNKNIKKPLYTLKNGYKPRGDFNTIVKIDKGLILHAIILVSKNGIYEEITTKPYEDDYIYDFTKSEYNDYNWQNKGISEVEKLASSDCYIILSNDNVQIKYKVIFKKVYTSVGFSPIIDLKIDELEEKLLNDEDYKQIKQIKEIRNENKK
ncbi:hypothetical protein [Malaciobacter marinus]|uniref:hypothetical protein n=1 Tax=Malaciobacter marinus TaxID=505249 RepID=UPI003B010068